jgi:hypothetical protein
MKILRWDISSDPAPTMAAYRTIDSGIECDCAFCRNFVRVGESAFPSEMHTIFNRLGIDFTKPVEIGHTHRTQSGLHCYLGWYHFVGAIDTGDNAHVPMDKEGTIHSIQFEKVSERLEVGFTMRSALVNDAFANQAVCQLEISLELPWVLEEDDPDL